MSWKAKTTVFNDKVVQSKPGQVAIGFPSYRSEVFTFNVPESELVAAKLRAWLKCHLEDNGVEFRGE